MFWKSFNKSFFSQLFDCMHMKRKKITSQSPSLLTKTNKVSLGRSCSPTENINKRQFTTIAILLYLTKGAKLLTVGMVLNNTSSQII